MTTTERELIAKQQAEIEDLTSRLQTALRMDAIDRDQELVTLKRNISWFLEPEYADYMKSKDRECSPDLFAFYRSMLGRVFKRLQRSGISCQP